MRKLPEDPSLTAGFEDSSVQSPGPKSMPVGWPCASSSSTEVSGWRSVSVIGGSTVRRTRPGAAVWAGVLRLSGVRVGTTVTVTEAAGSPGAVAVIVAEFGSGRVTSGTGFGIRRQGDTVWVATARHLVEDSLDGPATRIAVIFNGTGQVFQARMVRRHDSADVAVVAAWIRGGRPVVAGLSDSAKVGDPVAITGFPFGLDSLGDWRTTGTAATSTTGTITEFGPDLLSVDGYGTHGSSGSPIFAPNGTVVGLVSGVGRLATQRLIVVPAHHLAALLRP